MARLSMPVPTTLGKVVYGAGFTVSICSFAIARELLGRERAVRDMTRTWSHHLSSVVGLTVRTYGAENLDPTKPCVIMANHQSHMDILALFEGLPVQPGFLAKAELRRFPVFGQAMSRGGHVFIDRGRHERAVGAIKKAAQQVRAGRTLVIFPEGTRSDGERVKPFKKGGFHLAKVARVPIVPVGIRGTAAILSKHGRVIRPGEAEIHIGESIDTDSVRRADLDQLIRLTRVQIADLAGLPLGMGAHVSA